MSIDLFNPDRAALLRKWKPLIDTTYRIFTWTTESELAWLAELASRNSGTYLEIGSYVGKSALVQLKASPSLGVVSLDTWDDEGSFEEYQFNLRRQDDAGRVRAIPGASHHGIAKLLLESQTVFDYAFIDGGHLYDDVYGDIIGALKLIKKGGVICGHDYRANLPEDGVTKAVRETLGAHGPKNVIDSIWALQL
jgi:predicted O-methyltransferase YrrM